MTTDEMRLAIVAYDVMVAQFSIENYPTLLYKYFIAADAVPEEYIGAANHPDNVDAVEWHKNIIGAVDTP